MASWLTVLCAATALSVYAAAQKPSEKPASPPSSAPAENSQAQGKAKAGAPKPGTVEKKAPDPEVELQHALEGAGNDRAALVRNLEDYLRRFPNAPRKLDVYRAIIEAAMQLRDSGKALEYSERIIALNPEDLAMMLFAIDLLERNGDDHNLIRAVGYATRVLDRVEKHLSGERPRRVSQAEWAEDQKKLEMSVYLIRGRLHMKMRSYDSAVADLEQSFQRLPNAPAALRLGEIAELRKDYAKAIEQYSIAFVLPDSSTLVPVDRREVRRKLGNVWQLMHGSETGLGEHLLAAYDRLSVEPKPVTEPNSLNRNLNLTVSDPYDFVLRRPDGSAPLKLADARGKILVLNFWATWCAPCRELEPLFESVVQRYDGKAGIVFLAVNSDEDEARVAPYLEHERVRAAVVFEDGLGQLLRVRAYPTIIVLDGTGKIVYRAEGFASEDFVESLAAAIERAIAGAS